MLVTGGGTNLGLAAARELHAAGAQVVVAGRRPEPLHAAVAELGSRATAVVGDIRDPEQARAIVAGALDGHGRLDVLVNNAGGQFFAAAETIADRGWRAVTRLNIGGTLQMCEAARELAMGPAGGGTIVNVTVSPHHGFPAMAHSGAARAAVESATAELAQRWREEGIALVSLALGRLATDSLRKYPEEVRRSAAATVPLQRLGDGDEFGRLVVLLCGPVGRALSGSTVTLDGALDNWSGPWPPRELLADGRLPAEARRAPDPAT